MKDAWEHIKSVCKELDISREEADAILARLKNAGLKGATAGKTLKQTLCLLVQKKIAGR